MLAFTLQILFFLCLWGFWWYKKDAERYKKYPPGPRRLPFIGNMLQIMREPNYFLPAVFQKFAKKYGDVMFLKLGINEAIVFSTRSKIHEMLLHDKTAGRTQFQFIKDRHYNKNLGIIWGYGKPWETMRRFTFRNLREFGYGKSATMDKFVNEEIGKFVIDLRQKASQAPNRIILFDEIFSVTVVNALWRLMSGKSYDYNDPKLLKLVRLNSEFFRSANQGFDPFEALPMFRSWFPQWSRKNLQNETCNALYNYGKELLAEQRFSNNEKGQDETSFLDVFHAKLEENRSDSDTDTWTDDQFIMTVLDLLIGGSETSSNTLSFGILYMVLNPKIQEKVQIEIDGAIPPGVPFESSMKSQLPYTSATVLEIYRYSTVIPLPAPREATEDFYFGNYFVKKGTSLVFNLHAAHFDENAWGDPLNFRPERFLNSDGTAINPKMLENLEIFGGGRRFCIGQSLAETTIFLYFASLLRMFKFTKVPGTNPTVEPILGITTTPNPFLVHIEERVENH